MAPCLSTRPGLQHLIRDVHDAGVPARSRVEIKDKSGKVVRKYHMPSHAHLMVQDGETVEAGDVLAKIPRETTKTKDITGGLPRVVELFEARKPKDHEKTTT
jgi:DNA-directed RNA polymerase subunit beta'